MLKRPIQLTQVSKDNFMFNSITCSLAFFLEARAILDEWMNDKLRFEAGLSDSYDEEIAQTNVRSVKQACDLSFDEDNPLKFLTEPKDLFRFQDPSVYYETHDETDLVRDILHG